MPPASICCSKAPASIPGLRSAERICCRPEGASQVSACKNSSTSPAAAAAPRFCCTARPRGPRIRRQFASAAIRVVASLLPPSTTITSSGPVAQAYSIARAMPSASFSVGMIIEILVSGLAVLCGGRVPVVRGSPDPAHPPTARSHSIRASANLVRPAVSTNGMVGRPCHNRPTMP